MRVISLRHLKTRCLRSLDAASPRRLRWWLAIVVTLVMGTMITHGSYAASGDALHYMQIAHSIAFDHDLALGDDYRDPTNIIQVAPGNHAVPGVGGVLRPVHDIGLPLVAAPFFAVAYKLAELTNRLPIWLRRRAKLTPFIALRQLVSLFMIFVTALLAIVFFEVARQISGNKAGAFLWTLLWTLSPPIVSHGYVFFTEVPSALVALVVFWKRDWLLVRAPGWRGLALGVLTGYLILLHVRNVGIVLALVCLIGWRVRRHVSRGVGFAAGLAVMGLVKVFLNVRFWGTIVTTPHERFGSWPGLTVLVSQVFVRSGGLLFDPAHGLLFSAPLYLLVPAAFMFFARRSRRLSGELLLVPASYLLFVLLPLTNVHGWSGGWAPPARFLVPIVPFVAVVLPVLSVRGSGRVVLAAIVALQIGLDAFFWAHPMLLWSSGPGPAPFLEALIGVHLARSVPSWAGLTTLTVTMFAVCMLAWSGVTAWLSQPQRQELL